GAGGGPAAREHGGAGGLRGHWLRGGGRCALLRIMGLGAFLGLARLVLPQSAHAGVHVSIGLPLPVPLGVAPPPVVMAPPPPAVVYPAPVVVGPAYYGYYGYRPGHWRHPPYYHGWCRW